MINLCMFSDEDLWSSNQPTAVGHEVIRDALDKRISRGQILPNLSLAVDPLTLPSLRSLLLGSRFTASLSIYNIAISRCPRCTVPAARGNSVYDP